MVMKVWFVISFMKLCSYTGGYQSFRGNVCLSFHGRSECSLVIGPLEQWKDQAMGNSNMAYLTMVSVAQTVYDQMTCSVSKGINLLRIYGT
jgi:hypothetical protein